MKDGNFYMRLWTKDGLCGELEIIKPPCPLDVTRACSQSKLVGYCSEHLSISEDSGFKYRAYRLRKRNVICIVDYEEV